MKMKHHYVPLSEVERWVEAGWEVYGYSEFGKDGIPKWAELKKEMRE